MAKKDNTVDIVCSSLSDGSEVFDVYVGEVKLPAISEKDADLLAYAIRDAIERHTNETYGVAHLFPHRMRA